MKLKNIAGIISVVSTAGLMLSFSAMADLPSIKFERGKLVDPAVSRQVLGAQILPTGIIGGLGTRSAPEYKALARALGFEHKSADDFRQAAYAYVYNNIKVEYRYGLSKGGLGALIDQSGTSFDQAELLFELLDVGGYDPEYVLYDVTLSAHDFARWSGLKNGVNSSNGQYTVSAMSACKLMADGGIPASITASVTNDEDLSDCNDYSGNLESITFTTLGVDSGDSIWNPSLKAHKLNAGIDDLAAAMGCSSGDCTSALLTALRQGEADADGSISGVPYLQNLNADEFNKALVGNAKALQTYVQNNLPNSRIEELLGGMQIDPDANVITPISTGNDSSWDDMNNKYRTRVHVVFDEVDAHFYADDISTRSTMLVSYEWENGSRGTSLFVDHKLTANGVDSTPSNFIRFEVDHPYAAHESSGNPNGNFMDRIYVQKVPSIQVAFDGRKYTYFYLLASFGRTGKGMPSYLGLRTQEAAYKADEISGAGDDANYLDWACAKVKDTPKFGYGHQAGTVEYLDSNCAKFQKLFALSNWSAQSSRLLELIGEVNKTKVERHHSVGWISSDRSTYNQITNSSFDAVDLVSIESALSIVSEQDNTADWNSTAVSAGAIMSRLEGGVMEQETDAYFKGSGVSLLELSNQQSIKLLHVNGNNVEAALTQVVNYDQATKDAIRSYANSLYDLIVPQNGKIGAVYDGPVDVMDGGGFTFPDFRGYGWTSSSTPGQYTFHINNNAIVGMRSDYSEFSALVDGDLKGAAGSEQFIFEDMLEKARLEKEALQGWQKFDANVETGSVTVTPSPDVVTGSGSFPYSLPFQLTYSSAGNGLSHSQGHGTKGPLDWQHNYDVRLNITSSPFQAMGQDSALDAVALIVGLQAMRDLGRNSSFITRVGSAFAAHWAGNQLQSNAVMVQQAGSVAIYTKLPDGSYNSPPGSKAKLVADGTVHEKVMYRAAAGQTVASGAWSYASHSLQSIVTFEAQYNGLGEEEEPIAVTTSRWVEADAHTPGIYTIGDLQIRFTYYHDLDFTLFPGNGERIEFRPNMTDFIIERGFGYSGDEGESFGLDSRKQLIDKWKFPTNVVVDFEYQMPTEDTGVFYPFLNSVSNSLGRHLYFVVEGDYSIARVLTEGCPLANGQYTTNTPSCQYVRYVDNDESGLLVYKAYWDFQEDALEQILWARYVYGQVGDANSVYKDTYKLKSVYNASSNTSPFFTIQYDDVARLKAITDASGYTTSYYPAKLGGETRASGEVKDAEGAITKLTYDYFGQLLLQEDALGRETEFAFDSAGRIVRKDMPGGLTVTYDYDTKHNKTAEYYKARAGEGTGDVEVSWTYPGACDVKTGAANCHLPTTATDANGAETEFVYHTSGQPQIIKAPCFDGTKTCSDAGRSITNYRYDAGHGKVTQVVNPEGITTKYEYYTGTVSGFGFKGDLKFVTEGFGSKNLKTELRYDAIGNLVWVDGPLAKVDAADGRNDVVSIFYDGLRRPIFSVAADVKVADAKGNLIGASYQACAPSANFIVYDAVGRPLNATRYTWEYSSATCGSPSQASSQTVQNSYHSNGWLKYTIDPKSFYTYFNYDRVGRVTLIDRQVDPSDEDVANRRKRIVYDAIGREKKVYDAWRTLTGDNGNCQLGTSEQICYRRTGYTDSGKTKWVADPNGNKTYYDYDGLDRLYRTYFPVHDRALNPDQVGSHNAADYEEYHYDDNGNILARRTRKGDWIVSSYDVLNRVMKKQTYRQGNWNAGTREVTDGVLEGTVDYGYLKDGRDDSISQTQGPGITDIVVPRLRLSYGYDGAGRQTSETITRYDSASGSELYSRAVSTELNALGVREKLTLPGIVDGTYQTPAQVFDFTYDSRGLLTDILEGDTILVRHTYDGAGRRRSLTRNVGTSEKLVTAYDFTVRDLLENMSHTLDKASAFNVNFSFGYNGVKQIVSRGVDNGNYTHAATGQSDETYVPNGLNQYRSVTTNNVQTPIYYDMNGSVSQKGLLRYDYDVENRLVRVYEVGQENQGTRFEYDPKGRRFAKVHKETTRTEYLYEGDEPVADYLILLGTTALDDKQRLKARYLNGAGVDERIAYMQYNTTNDPTHGGKRVLFNYYMTNHQGSIIGHMKSEDGKFAGTHPYTYDAFGNMAAGSGGGQPFRYTGRRWDNETGLYYYRARYYDAAIGRFLQTDPIGYEDNMNLYAYTGNDPVNMTDPSGLSRCSNKGCFSSPEHEAAFRAEMRAQAKNHFIAASTTVGVAACVLGGCEALATYVLANPTSLSTGASMLDVGGGLGLGYVANLATRFGPLNKGPLAADIAETFRGASYTEKTLASDTTLYRVISEGGNPTGSYWTSTKPEGPLQSVIDSALDQNWGNSATKVVTANVPAGTVIYEGAAASQRGLVGGGNQIFIPKVEKEWIQ